MPAAYIRLWTLIFLGLLSPLEVTLAQSTTAISDCQNSCSGHGLCSNHPLFICSCDEGWGADSDVAEYKAPDCSLQTCPGGRSWFSIPTSATAAHDLRECSGNGVCQRDLGECQCFPPWTGAACDRINGFLSVPGMDPA